MSSDILGALSPGGAAREAEVSRARRPFLAGVCLTLLLAGLSLLLAVPSSVVMSPSTADALVPLKQAAPQGWAFFTRDPTQEYIVLYQHDGEGWETVSSVSASGTDNLFGSDRSRRTESYEIEMVVNELPEEEWVECGRARTMAECLPRTPGAGVGVRSHAEEPRFCGPVVYARFEPVPWAWAALAEEVPLGYVEADVDCRNMERGEEP